MLRPLLAMLAAGLATFNSLYATQAILPVLADYFSLTPSQASWTVSAATGALALAIVPASVLSEQFGRGRVIIDPLCAARWWVCYCRGLHRRGGWLSAVASRGCFWPVFLRWR